VKLLRVADEAADASVAGTPAADADVVGEDDFAVDADRRAR
jgi:hypothetical protein